MTSEEYRDLLRQLSLGTDVVASFLPAPANVVAKVIGRSLALAADLVDAGKDPVVEIERIRKRAPMLAEVEKGWQDKLERRWPSQPDTPPDVYEDED